MSVQPSSTHTVAEYLRKAHHAQDGVTQKDARLMVRWVFEAIHDTLLHEESLSIGKVGIFSWAPPRAAFQGMCLKEKKTVWRSPTRPRLTFRPNVKIRDGKREKNGESGTQV
jgi:nucleoid DNA-binding protein